MLYAISAESSGPFPMPGCNNTATELTALRIVTCPGNQLICNGVFARSDGLSVESLYNAITDEMVKGRPCFSEETIKKLMPLFFHQKKNESTGKLEYDTSFLCFGAGFYQELFRRYGIARDGLFVDALVIARDIRDTQARVNMPSNAAGTKMPNTKEVAEFLGLAEPKTPEDKTNLLCEVINCYLENRDRIGR